MGVVALSGAPEIASKKSFVERGRPAVRWNTVEWWRNLKMKSSSLVNWVVSFSLSPGEEAVAGGECCVFI